MSRGVNGSLFEVVGTPKADATVFSDLGVLPDREYAYHVRSGNIVGTSLASNVATATTPPTLEIALSKGAVKDTAKVGKDSISLAGTVAANEASADGAFDPMEDGFDLWLGGWTGQRLVTVPGGDFGWRVKKGKATWKSPKGSATKAKVVFVEEGGNLTVKLKGLTFQEAPAAKVRVTIDSGGDAGSLDSTWTGGKPGKFKFP